MEPVTQASPGAARATPFDFTAVRKALVGEFGKETIVALHRRRPLLDALAIAGAWGLFALLIFLLGTRRPGSALWIACLVLQGALVMAFGYMLHDLFVHRHVGGKTFAYWMGLAMGYVAYLIRTPYAEIHHDHHLHTGTDEDEAYKDDLDRRWKRFLFLTPVGYVLAIEGLLARARPARFPAPERAFGVHGRPTRRRAKRERRLLIVFWILLAAGAFLAPRFVVYGYLLPLLLVMPVLNVVRTVLEHAETDPGNAYHCATYYRTGPLTRPLFFWDGGDCHLVHHLLPHIPFYNMGRAVDLFRPFLLRQGVRERRSLARLLWGYLVRNEPHRALWST